MKMNMDKIFTVKTQNVIDIQINEINDFLFEHDGKVKKIIHLNDEVILIVVSF